MNTPTKSILALKTFSRAKLDSIRAEQLASKPGCYRRPANKLALILDILTTAGVKGCNRH